MVSKARARKIGLRIQETLADLIQHEVSDPRLQDLTVTDVEVDRELAYATVFVSSMLPEEERETTMRALERARGFLRSELAHRIELRTFPQLRFRWDRSQEQGERIEEILKQLSADSEGDEGDGS